MMKMHTYVNFPGTCKEALQFYEKHLGGKIVTMSTFDQIPGGGHVPPGLERSGVLHARIELGETILMASDGPKERVQPMRSAYLSLSLDSDAEAERIFKALSEGGEVFMPLEETFFASRFAQFRDKFGINWMLIHEKPMRPA
jgi:PhnB protein